MRTSLEQGEPLRSKALRGEQGKQINWE